MKIPGQEVIPYRTYTQELAAEVPRAIDLTFVFNQHSNASDAEKTASVIEPDSTVFMEGYSTLEGVQPWYKSDLELLARLRLYEGKLHPQYIELRDLIIAHIDAQLMTPRLGHTDFSQNALVSIKLLLEKDCIVQYADYFEIDTDSAGVKETSESFKVLNTNGESGALVYFGDEPSITKSISSLYRRQRDEYNKHYMREQYARAEVTTFFATYGREYKNDNDLNKTPTGKIKTYITYGTAHKDSLSNVFARNGFNFSKFVLNDSPESNLIPESISYFHENINRQMAHSALRAVSLGYVPNDELNVEQKQVYDNLEVVNGNTDELLKLLIRCHQIGQQFDVNSGRGLEWLTALRSEILKKPPQ